MHKKGHFNLKKSKFMMVHDNEEPNTTEDTSVKISKTRLINETIKKRERKAIEKKKPTKK